MANHKSSKKRARQTIRKTERNVAVRSKTKSVLRDAREAKNSKQENALDLVKKAVGQLQKAANKGVIHPRNAARKISRIMSGLKVK